MIKAQPFIKWVGGKRGLFKQILPFINNNFKNYHEPFLGGGAVFFELFSLGLLQDKKIFLSDLNSELINAYKVVQNIPNDLILNLENYKKNHSKEFYYKIRELDRKSNFQELSEIERATRFIYLNKTCFNGLYRVNKKGFFNTPIGSYKNPNIADKETILSSSKALQNVILLNQSFEKVINIVQKDDLVYLDPPYYPLNATSHFTSYDSNIFLDHQQKELFQIFQELEQLGVQTLQSNSDTDFIKNLYKDYRVNTVFANRFINSKANNRGKISEIIIEGVRI